MTTDAATTLAVGGERQVPVPDPVARDYLLLGLRLDQHIPGLVDAYFGPADLKARVDIEPLRAPAELADDADTLLARLPDEVPEPDRRDWLDAQLVALATHARALAGVELPYEDQLERSFAWRPVRRDDADVRGGGGNPRRAPPRPGAARRPPRRLGRSASGSRRTGSRRSSSG